MLPIVQDDFTIPDDLVIACPAKDFQLRRAKSACPQCNFFAGMAMMTDDTSMPFHKRFIIRCAHVMERRMGVVPQIIED